MKKTRTRKTFDFTYEKRTIPASLIDAETDVAGWDKKELKARAAYFLLNGVPEFPSTNRKTDGLNCLPRTRIFTRLNFQA